MARGERAGQARAGVALARSVGGALPAQVERHAALQPLPTAQIALPSAQIALSSDGLARLPQPRVADPLPPDGGPELVHVDLEVRELSALLADGVPYRFWTFN